MQVPPKILVMSELTTSKISIATCTRRSLKPLSFEDGDVSVGDPFFFEEQQDQQQFPFTEGKYNMGFPCTPIHLINYASACV